MSTAARQIRHALAEALGVDTSPANDPSLETVDVAGAAQLLHTTKGAIYERRRMDQMPVPLSRRPLVWRRADILNLRQPKLK